MTEIAIRPDAPPVAVAVQSAPALLTAWADAASAAHRLAAPLVMTDFVPAHFRPKGTSDEAVRTAQAAATAAVLYGAEAGLSPMQALQGIYVISGRPALYARTMLAITLAAGHEVWTEESGDNRAIVCARRRGTRQVERVVVTMDQARKANWTSNKKYTTEPATMLLARAQSQACRRVAPDALVGMAYSAEELEDETVQTTTASRASDAPKRTARRAAVPAPEEPELDEPPAASPESSDDLITAPQLKKLHAAMGERGLSDRAEGLAFLSATLGRDVTTSKDLSKDEASRVIDRLESAPVDEEPDGEEPGGEGAWPDVAQPPQDPA